MELHRPFLAVALLMLAGVAEEKTQEELLQLKQQVEVVLGLLQILV
jgi:hypothetical protein